MSLLVLHQLEDKLAKQESLGLTLLQPEVEGRVGEAVMEEQLELVEGGVELIGREELVGGAGLDSGENIMVEYADSVELFLVDAGKEHVYKETETGGENPAVIVLSCE